MKFSDLDLELGNILNNEKAETQAHFENIQSHILTTLETAEKQICVAVAWFTDKKILKMLEKKAEEGVKVELLLMDDEINRGDYGLDFSGLLAKGGSVHWVSPDEEENLMHNKFAVIDHHTVISGSYNWSNKAQRNRENITINSHNRELAKQFLEEFVFLKSDSHGNPLPRTLKEAHEEILQLRKELEAMRSLDPTEEEIQEVALNYHYFNSTESTNFQFDLKNASISNFIANAKNIYDNYITKGTVESVENILRTELKVPEQMIWVVSALKKYYPELLQFNEENGYVLNGINTSNPMYASLCIWQKPTQRENLFSARSLNRITTNPRKEIVLVGNQDAHEEAFSFLKNVFLNKESGEKITIADDVKQYNMLNDIGFLLANLQVTGIYSTLTASSTQEDIEDLVKIMKKHKDKIEVRRKSDHFAPETTRREEIFSRALGLSLSKTRRTLQRRCFIYLPNRGGTHGKTERPLTTTS